MRDERADGSRASVTLCCDYMVRFPVWDAHGALDVTDLPLSESLVAGLLQWQEHWELWHDEQLGWRGEQHVHEAEGARLLREIRRELKSDYDVTLAI